MKRYAVAGLMILAAVIAIYSLLRPTPLKYTIDPLGLSVLENATSVEAFQISPERSNTNSQDSIEGYPITSHARNLGKDFARRLSDVLLSRGVSTNRKKCGLEPGVAFRITHNEATVIVLVCFECDVLWAFTDGEASDNPSSQYQDFDLVRSQLVSLSKEAFPDDEEIQRLSEAGQD